MSEEKTVNKGEKYINWEIVDEFLEAGCTGTEISAMLGICNDTLYLRCQKEHGMGFSVYSQQKRSKGDAGLRKAQYDEAMGGDRGMLIWLGKQRLGQRDNPDDEGKSEKAIAVLNEIANLMIDGKSNKLNVKPKAD